MDIMREWAKAHQQLHEGASRPAAPVVVQTVVEIVKVVETRVVEIRPGYQQTQARVVRQGASNEAASVWVPVAAPAASVIEEGQTVTVQKPTSGTVTGGGGGSAIIIGPAGGGQPNWGTYISPE